MVQNREDMTKVKVVEEVGGEVDLGVTEVMEVGVVVLATMHPREVTRMMNLNTRRKYRYLGHSLLTCSIADLSVAILEESVSWVLVYKQC